MVQYVFTLWLNNMVTSPTQLVSTDFGTCIYYEYSSSTIIIIISSSSSSSSSTKSIN